MGNYYNYREVKVMIAHRLMALDGWKIYGYSPDQSDFMTDYYHPAYWGGVAEKNGYVLCVNVYGPREPEEVREYYKETSISTEEINNEIEKLQKVSIKNNSCISEVETAKKAIAKLQKKKEEAKENNCSSKYKVVDTIPGYMAHPKRCNWHIEKDGIVITKGNGILKYGSIDCYYSNSKYINDMNNFRTKSKEVYISEIANKSLGYGHYRDIKEAKTSAESHYKDMLKNKKLIDQFESFINKIDTTCGGLIGKGDGTSYEKVTVTEYKNELKVVECSGEIKEGQCFILKTGFTYNCYKGLVYRIHIAETDNGQYIYAYKLNKKLTKECTGRASSNNRWSSFGEKFLKLVEEGSISFCEIKEERVKYDVEKFIKRKVSSGKTVENKDEVPSKSIVSNITYDIIEDIDTRDGNRIYVVKVKNKLTTEEFKQVNIYIKSLGGYYSRFKCGFIFKENPSILRNSNSSVAISKSKIQESKQSKKQKKSNKIKKQIAGIKKKVDALSGNYKTNTWKRLREQQNRESKIEDFEAEISILLYLLDTIENRELTILEENLILSSFREQLHSYYKSKEAYDSQNINMGIRAIEYPRINLGSMWDDEVPKMQKRLNKAGIYNTDDLLEAVEVYGKIYSNNIKQSNAVEKKINQLEREYKMQQKGDINFTPLKVVTQLIQYAKINKNSRVLEPSAGIGNIADQVIKITNKLDVIEQKSNFCDLLKLKGHNVIGNDFLEYAPINKYDAIIMNPPFSDELNHIKHAYSLLKDGGVLVTISSPSWTFARSKKAIAFREWLEEEAHYTSDLPGGTFEMTNVASKVLVIEKRESVGVEAV